MARIIDRRNGSLDVVEKDQYNRKISDCLIDDSDNWFGVFQSYDDSGRISTHETVCSSSDSCVEEKTYRSVKREYSYYIDGSGRTVKSTTFKRFYIENRPVKETSDTEWFDELLVDGEFIPEEEVDS